MDGYGSFFSGLYFRLRSLSFLFVFLAMINAFAFLFLFLFLALAAASIHTRRVFSSTASFFEREILSFTCLFLCICFCFGFHIEFQSSHLVLIP
jgi:hypothetical protein